MVRAARAAVVVAATVVVNVRTAVAMAIRAATTALATVAARHSARRASRPTAVTAWTARRAKTAADAEHDQHGCDRKPRVAERIFRAPVVADQPIEGIGQGVQHADVDRATGGIGDAGQYFCSPRADFMANGTTFNHDRRAAFKLIALH